MDEETPKDEDVELGKIQSVVSSSSSECISIQTIDSRLKEDLYAEVIFTRRHGTNTE